ncbi:MAG: PAS domain S-box protein [Deltaproteobacteria bacterium]|nr:MAG: PAS domain S-box protein [Deltaproteobacteria bacterium]
MKRAIRLPPVRTALRLLPVGKKLGLIVLLFVFIVACLLVLANAQMEILSAVRAYVGGEGLWSKGEKDAVHHLARYAETRDEHDYRRYLAAIAVPLGDKQARLELDKSSPTLRLVQQGFVQGRNHPDDVDRMAMLFRRFRHVSYIAKAIAIWTAGDRYIATIAERGQALHAEIASGRPSQLRVGALLQEIGGLDERVTPLEDAFSRTLSKGARHAKRLLLDVTVLIAVLLVSIGVLLSWMMLRHIRAWEARYRHLLNTANDAITVASLETGIILDANRKTEELLGVSVSRILGRHQTELHPESEHDACRRLFDEEVRMGHATNSDLHLRRADGHLVPVEISAAVTELGGRAVVQSIFRDITERKRADHALRDSEERYRGLFEGANDLVYTHDLAGNFTSINRAAERITGYSAAEAVGMNLSKVVAPEHLELARDMVSRKVASGGPTVYELDVITNDGRRVPLEVSTRLMLREGKPVAVQGIARDIRERRRTEAERAELLAREQAARAEAELANRAKDEFLATLSHELRTPLSAILIWARLLRSGRLEAEAKTRALEVIERNTKLQARLIEDLLEVSRIIAGKLRLELAPVDLASTVESAIDAVRAAADAKEIALQCDLDHDVGPARGDRSRLQQIVWNLVANAIKFTPNGGQVDVRLARDAQGAVITVRDTGIGIQADFLPHIFERFRQADSTSTRVHGGLGLGLAIVRHLVELHGGTVAAASPGAGQGATFTVRLPISARSIDTGDAAWLSTLARRSGQPFVPLDGIHVLLVEDESDMRESVAMSLDLCGARVTAVGSAVAALEVLDRDPPDVILCDIGMPGEDGYTLVRRIRARGPEHGGETPMVALTAYARDEDRSHALEAGFQSHVPKPVEPSEIARVVAALCRSDPRVGRIAAARRR